MIDKVHQTLVHLYGNGLKCVYLIQLGLSRRHADLSAPLLPEEAGAA